MSNCNDEIENVDALTKFKAAITTEKMEDMERHYQEMSYQRRLVLAILTNDADKLFEAAETQTDVTKQMFEQTMDYLEQLDTLKKLASTSCTRLLIVLAGLEDSSHFEELSSRWAEAVKLPESA